MGRKLGGFNPDGYLFEPKRKEEKVGFKGVFWFFVCMGFFLALPIFLVFSIFLGKKDKDEKK